MRSALTCLKSSRRANTSSDAIYSNIYNPVWGTAPTIGLLGDPQKETESKATSFGIADTLSFFDERIQFTAGLRYQQLKLDGFNITTGAQNSGYESSAWTPAFGLVVKPRENVSLYANYIEGLEAGTTVGSTFANAGEVFAPYASKQYETGVKVDWGRVTTTLAAFQISQPNTITTTYPGDTLPTLELNGEQRNRGIELNAYGEVFDGVRLLGGVAFIDARQTRTANGALDGERAFGAPRNAAIRSRRHLCSVSLVLSAGKGCPVDAFINRYGSLLKSMRKHLHCCARAKNCPQYFMVFFRGIGWRGKLTGTVQLSSGLKQTVHTFSRALVRPDIQRLTTVSACRSRVVRAFAIGLSSGFSLTAPPHDLEVVRDAPTGSPQCRGLLDPPQLFLDHPGIGGGYDSGALAAGFGCPYAGNIWRRGVLFGRRRYDG